MRKNDEVVGVAHHPGVLELPQQGHPRFRACVGGQRQEFSGTSPAGQGSVLEEQEDYQIGKYGRMRERFLREHRTGTYTSLLMSGKLHAHLYEIDTLVHQRMEELVAHMTKVEGTGEALKARVKMEWVGRMDNYRHCAEEVVFEEIIYV